MHSSQRLTLAIILSILICPSFLVAAQHRGSVRAADQFIPGATVTARQGALKHVTYTDESGLYLLELEPGAWDIQVEILGFIPLRESFSGDRHTYKDWTLEMPRAGETITPLPDPAEAKPVAAAAPKTEVAPPQPAATPAKPAPAETAKASAPPATPAAPATPANRSARNRTGRPTPGFQNATAKATEEGQQALAEAPTVDMSAHPGGESEDTFLVNGSTSGGLGASSDEEARRQRMIAGSRGPGGPGGEFGDSSNPAAMGLPPGMGGSGIDSLGLGGLGTSAINGGFGGGQGGDPLSGGMGRGGPGGGGPGGSGMRGGGGPGGGGGGVGGSMRGGGGGRSQSGNRRGPGGVDFASFGNRRSRSPYNGTLFLGLNNSALNAAPYSLTGQAAPKPSYAQSRFGVTFGGPLTIPKLLAWPRASFSISYSGSVSRNPYSQISSLPTEAERSGDFSQPHKTPFVIFDPLSQLPFAGNIIPTARISSISAGLMKYIPLPTYATSVQNYQLVRSTPSNSGSIGVRFNMPLSRKDRLSVNYQHQGRDSESQQLFGFRDTSTGSGMSASLGWSHSFAPRFNNSANLSLSRNDNESIPYFAYKENVAGTLGITGTSQEPINYGPPSLSFTNFGALSDGSASVGRNQTISFNDNVTYVYKRRHNLTFGFSYRKMQQNSLTSQNARGAFSFSGLVTSAIDANGRPLARTGFDFADFLLGLPQSSSLRYGSDNNYFRGWSTNAFAQDDWRISRKLSFNFGLRYEYFAPYTELHGHLANLDLNPTLTAASVVTAGQPGPYSGELPNSLVRPDTPNFSPRFGFALRPFSKRGVMFRGGYSIFYSGAAYGQLASQMASQAPFAITQSLSTSASIPLSLANGFPIIPKQTITNTWAIDPDYKLAYAQSWVFAVQNSFKHGILVELEYVGTKGTNLGLVFQPNRASPGTSLTDVQNQLPIANATGFSYQTSDANSSYNSGQVRVTRRFMRGMSGMALYTYSKSLDNASSFNGTGGSVVQFNNNLHLERGLSTFDQRHRISGGFMLSSPVGIHGMFRNGGWKTKALTGWMLTGNFSSTSGTPLTARVAGNLSNTGGGAAFGTGRAQATGLDIHDGDFPYFNLLAFTIPPPGQYGNAGRTTIPGPMHSSLSAGLNRAFRFGDTRRTLQFRMSANNALNRVTITGFGTTVNSSTYGLPTAAAGMRTVSLMLRFSF